MPVHTGAMQRQGETMAFVVLAAAAAMTIVWAVSTVKNSAAQYEQIETALSKAPALYAATNTTGRSLGSGRMQVHGAAPAALVF